MKFLKFLNGKKTTIGGIIFLLGRVLTILDIGVPPGYIDAINEVGFYIIGVGVVHKGIKEATKRAKKDKTTYE